jgi:hypothetical protein
VTAPTPGHKRPRDLAVELLVYAPVGLAVSAKEVVPRLVERGRTKVTTQVSAARIIGRFAVEQGQLRATKAFARAREEAQQRLDQVTAPNGSPPRVAPRSPVVRPATPTPRPATSGPGGAELAIPGYDSLSASQVLPRLEGLSDDELESVRVYESAHRGRKTILGRITQLQAPS